MGGPARLLLGLTLIAGGITIATLESGAAEEPAIRAFDVVTIERLGREMYEQDQCAWKATDVMTAAKTEAGAVREGLAGWITSDVGGKPAVRFIRNGERGPEVLYDVSFEGLAPGTLTTPLDRTLSAVELAQREARRLAVSQIGQRCGPQYNTIALKEANGDWLVWVLVATLNADVIPVGGNLRFTISPDGKTVRTRDALSKSCIKFDRDRRRAGEEEGLMFSHVVSLTPVETHVLASLTHSLPLFVGTQDGVAWKVDQGRVKTVEMDAPGLDGFSARTRRHGGNVPGRRDREGRGAKEVLRS